MRSNEPKTQRDAVERQHTKEKQAGDVKPEWMIPPVARRPDTQMTIEEIIVVVMKMDIWNLEWRIPPILQFP